MQTESVQYPIPLTGMEGHHFSPGLHLGFDIWLQMYKDSYSYFTRKNHKPPKSSIH